MYKMPLEVYCSGGAFLLYYILCMWEGKDLVKLHVCAGSSETFLLSDEISTKILFASLNVWTLITHFSSIEELMGVLIYNEIYEESLSEYHKFHMKWQPV